MDNKFFKDLKKGLEEVIAYQKGKLDLESEEIEISELSAQYDDSEDIILSSIAESRDTQGAKRINHEDIWN